MPITLAQAAEQCGVNRSTLLRAVKSGKISGTRDDAGVWSVDPAEVFRVFEPAPVQPKGMPQLAQVDVELRMRAELAEARLGDLRQTLEDMRRAHNDMREERDRWRGQAERLLPGPTGPEKGPVARSWWPWRRRA
jgi:hypothetical protein